MRKIFQTFLIILPLFLLLFFAKANTLAASCSSLGGTCQSQQACSVQGGGTISGATDCTSTQYCCSPNNSAIPPGSYGCAFKLSQSVSASNGTITIPPENMLISCQSGAVCIPDKNSSSTIVNGVPEIFNGLCVSTSNQCPVCDKGYQYTNQGDCVSATDYTKRAKIIRTDSCKADQGCSLGFGCGGAEAINPAQPLSACVGGSCQTALGPLPTDLPGLLTRIFSIVLAIAGVAALGLIIASGYKLMVSQGNPEQVKGAREQLTAAIIGLLFIIFSLVILQVIGVNILNIPGFT